MPWIRIFVYMVVSVGFITGFLMIAIKNVISLDLQLL